MKSKILSSLEIFFSCSLILDKILIKVSAKQAKCSLIYFQTWPNYSKTNRYLPSLRPVCLSKWCR